MSRPENELLVHSLKLVLRTDFCRLLDLSSDPPLRKVLATLLAAEGFWSLAVYRFGRWLKARDRRGRFGLFGAIAQRLMWIAYGLAHLFVRLVLDVHLSLDADIGPGFYVGHFKSIIIGAGVRIGEHCNIGQMCVITGSDGPFGRGAPTVGDRVYFGAGCKVIGPVRIASDVAIGANAVVLEDVPDRAVVVGNPARVVSRNGSEEFVSPKEKDSVAGIS